MLVKVLTMRSDPRIEGFDDSAIWEFGRDKETLSVRGHFFVKDDVPYWAVMLTDNLPVRDAEADTAVELDSPVVAASADVAVPTVGGADTGE